MLRWWPVVLAAAFAKLVWGVIVVFLLAAQEPFWHQVVIILGGAAITGGCTVGAAWMMTRQVREPVKDLTHELHDHRQIVEDPDRKTSTP